MKHHRPPLTTEQILAWADAHKARTGQWPRKTSGPVRDGYLGDNWLKIDNALKLGLRGLDGGSTLARLLVEARGVRSPRYLPELSEETILAWADRHHRRTGDWPNDQSGEVAEAEGEDWHNIDAALRQGLRGLPGGSSLAQLLHEYRRNANRLSVARLTAGTILGWADAHHARTGNWPKMTTGKSKAPGATPGPRCKRRCTLDLWLAGRLVVAATPRRAPRCQEQVGLAPRLTLRQIRRWAWRTAGGLGDGPA
jgi:hypothetical protein